MGFFYNYMDMSHYTTEPKRWWFHNSPIKMESVPNILCIYVMVLNKSYFIDFLFNVFFPQVWVRVLRPSGVNNVQVKGQL